MVIFKNKWQGKQWFSEDIYRLIKQRDIAFETARISKKSEDWDLFRQLRNKTVDICRKAKRKYLEEKLDNNKRSPKLMWKTLKEMLKGNPSNIKYKEMECKNEINNNKEEMSNKFNCYFIDSVRFLTKTEDIEMDFLDSVNKTDKALEVFQIIGKENLCCIVQKLENKSGTEEGITVEIMKLVVEIAAERYVMY